MYMYVYTVGALREVLKVKKYSDLTVNLFGKYIHRPWCDKMCMCIHLYM